MLGFKTLTKLDSNELFFDDIGHVCLLEIFLKH